MWRKHIDDCLDISIHALVKRATFFAIDRERRSYISIHALVKRATLRLTAKLFMTVFQSTPS